MVGVFGGNRRDNGTYQHLGKPACGRKNDRADNESDIDERRTADKKRNERVYRQSDYRQNGGKLYRFGNIEFVREKGENQIHGKLCDEVNQHQQSEERIGNPVQRAEGNEQHGGKIPHHRHGNVDRITGEFQPFVARLHRFRFLL